VKKVKRVKKVTKSRDIVAVKSDKVFETLFAGLASNPQLIAVISSIKPYIPALKRSGLELLNDVAEFASKGMWTEADRLMWVHMTDEERSVLFSDVLSQTRDAVDRAYERQEVLKEVAIKVAMGIITTLI
jgi:hypothetical protein